MDRPAPTPRLRFLPITIGDLALYSALYGDADTMRHIGAPITAADTARNLHDLVDVGGAAACGWTLWVLRSDDGSADIGIAGLCRADNSGEIGIMLLPAWRNRGMAGEAILAIRDHAFRSGALTEVFACHEASHGYAERLMRPLGFTREPAGDQVRWSCRKTSLPALASTPTPRHAPPLRCDAGVPG